MYRDCTQSDLNVTANPHAGWPRAVYRIVGSYPSGTRLAEAVGAGCARTCNLIGYIDKKGGASWRHSLASCLRSRWGFLPPA